MADVLARKTSCGVAEACRTFAAGHPLEVESLECLHGPARSLGASLAGELGVPVRVAALLSPPGVSGSHFSLVRRSTWLLQTHGIRTWHLASERRWGPLAPLQGELDSTVVTLRPGDALYLPSGLARRAGPAGVGEPSLHLELGLEHAGLTWASLVGLCCARVLLGGGCAPDGLGGLEAALLEEAVRIRALSRMEVPNSPSGTSGALDGFLPAVLQHSVSVPTDLPAGLLDGLERRLAALLARLRAVGHLERALPGPAGDALHLRGLVDGAAGAAGAVRREALAWALAELRRRGVHSGPGKTAQLAPTPAGEPFSALARAYLRGDGDLRGLTFARAGWARPLLTAPRSSAEEGHELLVAGRGVPVAPALAAPVGWCLGRWAGAGGRPFRLGGVPGDAAAARQAVELMLHAGVLDVVA